MHTFRRSTLAFALAALLGACNIAMASGKPVVLPDPRQDAALAAGKDQVAVFAGGCFWAWKRCSSTSKASGPPCPAMPAAVP